MAQCLLVIDMLDIEVHWYVIDVLDIEVHQELYGHWETD